MWNQPFSGERVQYNGAQAYALRSLTLSIAGSVAGVLGLNNLAGFAFYGISVAFVNTVIALVLARGQLERYFVVSAPPVPDAAEALTPKSAARLRAPRSAGSKAFSTIKWILLQGAQANVLSFVLWWTFWYGIVHVYE
ncbi:hypothetical protein MCUN1_002065 [Malassezia cuniculi]|uniref:ER membrane protein complex subunit 6 n=1 Tax=Malassezia cuniculi TaxID=948313 RepID=A0AAF0ERH9_9BASI|nr:hypothetical protein MCUN1_002065 [Malassezia cuniculi]